MENASQALLIAGGVLIAILVISLGVYIFGSASNVSRNVDESAGIAEIQKFNSKLEIYNKQSYYVNNDSNVNGNNVEKTTKWLSSYDKAEWSFANYNTISEVVSACNLAYDINERCNYDIQAGVQVYIIADENYIISPRIQEGLGLERGRICKHDYKEVTEASSKDGKRAEKLQSVPSGIDPSKDVISLNSLFSSDYGYLDAKLDTTNGEQKRIYHYGFDGYVWRNTETDKIDSIVFVMKVNKIY